MNINSMHQQEPRFPPTAIVYKLHTGGIAETARLPSRCFFCRCPRNQDPQVVVQIIMSTVLLIELGIICVAEYHTHPPPTHKKIISPVPCPLNETSVQYFCCCFRFSFEDRCFIDFGFVLAPSWLPNRHFLASICGFTKSIEENPRRCCNDAAGMLCTDGKGRFGGGERPLLRA